MKYFILVLTLFTANGCSKGNVGFLKEKAPEFLKKNGNFEIVTYEGYQYSVLCQGYVWYNVKRPNSDTIYNLALCKWGDEIHIYNFKAINAIKGN